MLLVRGYRKAKGIFKSINYKIIYNKYLKGPLFSMGKGGEILIIGKSSSLIVGRNNVIRNNVSLRVTGGNLTFGNNVFINDNCSLVSRKSINIGNDCLIGQNVCIYDNNHNYKENISISKQGFTIAEVHIGNNVWIGSNAIILPGVRIGNNVVIGAGAIVNKSIPDNSIYYNKIYGIIKEIDRDS
ncbi:acyltransferase [Bacillus sp. UNCCL81]|uniref:acyltransferase n=1 Tax=Bacillus sp. UNCCL81 TaxID=1502755 RepID=UPI0008F019C2|nr:acyltransferase [Bacillus sp. UNCCL81]SFD10038.1 Acetyltransferase (isoleucine patch superfamily) [Bacillus sp. UNCCL81]